MPRCHRRALDSYLAGGRFTFNAQESHGLATAMCEDLGGLEPGFPSPAGGMTIEKIGATVDSYGEGTLLLIGGSESLM